MKINKRTVAALRKRNLSEIGRQFNPSVSREAVRQWLAYARIPDKRVETVAEFTGLKIR